MIVAEDAQRPRISGPARRVPALLIVGLALAGLSAAPPTPSEGPAIAVETVEMKPQDLAYALGVDSFCYRLRFREPVRRISLRPCELRRQPDGSWKRTYLATGSGMSHAEKIRECNVSVFILRDAKPMRFAVCASGFRWRGEFDPEPDFDHTFTTPTAGRIIDGCLVLAYESKDRENLSDREEDLARLIAIEVDTRDLFRE